MRLLSLAALACLLNAITLVRSSCGVDDPPRELTNSLDMKLVLIPSGELLMGAAANDDLARTHEKPRHPVRISMPFYMGVHEVTFGQFEVFVQQTKYKTAAETDGKGTSGYNPTIRGFDYGSEKYSWRHTGYPQTASHPVVNINWHDASAFCKWLSDREKRRYRLPTEAEWEYACRAGTTSRFLVGNERQALREQANANDQALAQRFDPSTVKRYGLDPKTIQFLPWDDGYPFTAPVGSFKPNAFGLYDMLGNVGEFCNDWYESSYYEKSPRIDPQGPMTQQGHVVRGGTFLNGPQLVRASSRVECPDIYRNYVIGFRVVLDSADR